MTTVEEFVLPNGLTVLVEEIESTPLVTLNILYKVGSKHETPEKTGFAHLFEHFMFEGSKNIPHFDSTLQVAGGDNNAFTTVDLTNYYETLPAINIETALWLESDRMLELDFNQQSLDTQISVVCEEFKQNYLNKPYGDVWHLLMDLCYKSHPYRWPTIGLKLEHIEHITLKETKDFFYTYYRPNNAILSIAGGVKTADVIPLVKKWFGDIPAGPSIEQPIKEEDKQTHGRTKEVTRDVPSSVIYKAYHCFRRTHPDYYALDVITEILGTGDSSRLYLHLVDELGLCTEIDAYLSGTDEHNLLVIEAKPEEGVSLHHVDNAIVSVLKELQETLIERRELDKVINKACNYLAFTNESHQSKAFNMAYFKSINSMHLYNNEQTFYQSVTPKQIKRIAESIFTEANSNTLYYNASSNE